MALTLKLRGKILLVMLLLAVVPLVLSLFYLSGYTREQIRSSMIQYASKAGNFVERSSQATQRELTNYIRLFSSTSDLVNAVYYASLTADVEQVRDALAQIRELGLTEVDSAELHPLLSAAIETGETQAAMTNYLGQLSVLVVTPITLQEQVVGYLMGASLLDDEFALQIAELSGVELALISRDQIVGASHPGFRRGGLLQEHAASFGGGAQRQ